MPRQDYLRVMRNRLRITEDTPIDPAAIDKPGNVFNVLANLFAAGCEDLEKRQDTRFAAHLRASARDDDLDRDVLEDTFGRVVRKGASAAIFTLKVSRTDTVSGFVPEGSEILAGGLAFALFDPQGIPFATGQLGPVTASFICTTLGAAGNLAPDQVRGFRQPQALFDPTLTVEPTSTGEGGYATGGAEREGDADLIARSELWARGQDVDIDLLAAEALAVAGIALATASEDSTEDGTLTGSVTLYVADVNGRANAGLLARVRAHLREARMLGQEVTIVGAAPSWQSIVLRIASLDGFALESVQGSVRSAVVDFVNRLAPGATLAVEDLAATIKGVPGVAPFLSSAPFGVVTPGSSVVAPSKATIFRTRSDLVSFG